MASNSGSQKKLGLAVALALAAVLVVGGTVAAVFPSASNQGYQPDQPIPFSHKLHAGDNKIACMYCHSGPEKSRHSTVPSGNVCMNCHSVVRTESPWIQQVKQAVAENKPIEWVRIHELPDYVYFPHKRHIAAGLACENCHGDVKTMEKVYQFSPLTMGWCMQCHRGETTPRNVLMKYHPGVKNPQGLPVAPVNCSTCHN